MYSSFGYIFKLFCGPSTKLFFARYKNLVILNSNIFNHQTYSNSFSVLSEPLLYSFKYFFLSYIQIFVYFQVTSLSPLDLSVSYSQHFVCVCVWVWVCVCIDVAGCVGARSVNLPKKQRTYPLLKRRFSCTKSEMQGGGLGMGWGRRERGEKKGWANDGVASGTERIKLQHDVHRKKVTDCCCTHNSRKEQLCITCTIIKKRSMFWSYEAIKFSWLNYWWVYDDCKEVVLHSKATIYDTRCSVVLSFFFPQGNSIESHYSSHIIIQLLMNLCNTTLNNEFIGYIHLFIWDK